MTVRYGINWMGVANREWYRKRGLLRKVSKTLTEDNPLTGRKAGETVEYEETIEEYCCGRIDVHGTGCGPYGDEIGLDPMKAISWARFGDWLETVETDYMWELKHLVELYERDNPKIEWWEDNNE